jgi:hypothetical protein
MRVTVSPEADDAPDDIGMFAGHDAADGDRNDDQPRRGGPALPWM